MTPERLFPELLGLGLNWDVVESRFERESGTVHLEVRETPQLWELVRCPKDTGLVFCYDHTEVRLGVTSVSSIIAARSPAGCRVASAGSAAMSSGCVRLGRG